MSGIFAPMFELMQDACGFVFYWKTCSGFNIIFVQMVYVSWCGKRGTHFSMFLALPLILLQISSSKCEVQVALAHGRAPLALASVGLQCTLFFQDHAVTKPCLCIPSHSRTEMRKHLRGLTFYSWAKKQRLTTLPLADPLRVGGSIPAFHFSSTVKCIAFIFPASQCASEVICQSIA